MIEPAESDLFDLPDYQDTHDEPFLPLPPPALPGAEDGEDNLVNGEQEGSKLSQTKDSSAASRRAVKRPLPKLDAQRLISERGLPALRNMFDNVKFKGTGYEAADLKTLLRHVEHWAHRLFPKLQFEDIVERIERLGNKAEVRTCLKRIRLDLPILHEDFISNEGEDEGSKGLTTTHEEIDIFSAVHNASEELDSSSHSNLTEEQQQRIKRNRQIALERRKAKTCNSQLQEQESSGAVSNEEYTVDQKPGDLTPLETGNVSFHATENNMQCGGIESD